MTKYKYGEFSESQFDSYIRRLHKDVHWLLIYKDPKESNKYSHVNYEKYHRGLMEQLNGLNRLLFYPDEMVQIIANLEGALYETEQEDFNFKSYRKLILDTQSLIDKISESR